MSLFYNIIIFNSIFYFPSLFLFFYFFFLFSCLCIFPQIFQEPHIALRKIHIVKYPTSNAAENLVFKLRHAMGDGFSPMGALLYCLLRADTTNLLKTFLSFKVSANLDSEKSLIKQCQEFFLERWIWY